MPGVRIVESEVCPTRGGYNALYNALGGVGYTYVKSEVLEGNKSLMISHTLQADLERAQTGLAASNEQELAKKLERMLASRLDAEGVRGTTVKVWKDGEFLKAALFHPSFDPKQLEALKKEVSKRFVEKS